MSTSADPTTPTSAASPAAGALVLSEDAELTEQLHRLAAAAGTDLHVVADPEEARAGWPVASVVLVGPDQLPLLAETAPVRRPAVHVVCLGTAPATVFPDALAVGAESVVELPSAETWLVETLADTTDGGTQQAPVVGVVGGSGGAGATTFATALGQAAATSTHPVTLIDVDPVGAGVERVAGLDDVPGAGWATLLQSAGRLGSRSLRSSLPYRDGMAVLGWGDGPRSELAPVVVREVLSAARRGSSLVVVDLPRHPSVGARELLHRCDMVVVVTLLRLPALAATARVVADLLPGRSRGTPAAMVVTRGPASALDPREVAETLGLPLAAAMTDQRRLAEAVELGTGPLPRRRGPLFRAARSTLARIEGHAAGARSTR
jgi:secretion/DNA translocation related CpaE-like protein